MLRAQQWTNARRLQLRLSAISWRSGKINFSTKDHPALSEAQNMPSSSISGKVVGAELSSMVSRMREKGTQRRWNDVFTLVRAVPLEELLSICKDSAYKVAAAEIKKKQIEQRKIEGGPRSQIESNVPVTPKLESAFTDLLEAYVTAKHSNMWPVLEETFADPILANAVGVRRLRRACMAMCKSQEEADERMMHILSRWILHAPSFDHRRTLIHVLLRSVDLSVPNAETAAVTADAGLRRGFNLALKLSLAVRAAIDEKQGQLVLHHKAQQAHDRGKVAVSSIPSAIKAEAPELALGDTALLAYTHWCKLNLPENRGPRLGQKLFETLCLEGGADRRLLQPSFLRPELFVICTYGALGWAGLGASDSRSMRSKDKGKGEIKDKGKDKGQQREDDSASNDLVTAGNLSSNSASSSSLSDTPPPRDQGSSQQIPDSELVGLTALLDLAWDNSPPSLVLRQKFFNALASASSRGGSSVGASASWSSGQLVLHFAKRLQQRKSLLPLSGTGSSSEKQQQQQQQQQLLLGTGVWNCVAEALAAQGLRNESFEVLEAMNAEKRLPAARLAFDAAQSWPGLEGRELIAFGPNVHTYIQVANSRNSVSSAVRAKREAEWPHTMLRLFNRLTEDGVVPDMRLLFNMSDAARELSDFDFVTRVIERAHLIAQVPRKRILSTDEARQAGDAQEVEAADQAMDWSVGNGRSQAWQPRTTMPRSSSNERGGGSMSANLTPQGPRYIPSKDDFSQIYYYGIAVASKCSRPEDCLVLLLLMVQMDLKISEQTMLSVLRCLVKAGSSVHLEEVTRLFGLMPRWGIKRDEGHAACFVEALAKLGRFGDASVGLGHMKTTGKALSPATYAVVSTSLMKAMADLCPRAGAGSGSGSGSDPGSDTGSSSRHGELTSTVGWGKKPLGPDEAVDVVAGALRRIAKLSHERSGDRGFTNDYLLKRALHDTVQGFVAFDATAHPNLVRRVWERFQAQTDKNLSGLFSSKLPTELRARLKAYQQREQV